MSSKAYLDASSTSTTAAHLFPRGRHLADLLRGHPNWVSSALRQHARIASDFHRS